MLYLLVWLSSIVVIAIAQNLLYTALDLFIRDRQTSEIPQRKSWFPDWISWWEKIYLIAVGAGNRSEFFIIKLHKTSYLFRSD